MYHVLIVISGKNEEADGDILEDTVEMSFHRKNKLTFEQTSKITDTIIQTIDFGEVVNLEVTHDKVKAICGCCKQTERAPYIRRCDCGECPREYLCRLCEDCNTPKTATEEPAE